MAQTFQNLKEAMAYTATKLGSPEELKLRGLIMSGQLDEQAKKEGINLQPIKDWASQQQPKKDGFISKVTGGIKSELEQAKQDITEEDERGGLSKGISAVSHVASAVSKPISEIPVIKQVGESVGKIIDFAGGKLADLYSPEFQQKLANMDEEEFTKYIQPLQDISNLGNIAGTILGAKGGQKGIKATGKVGATVAGKGIEQIGKATEIAGRATKASGESVFKSAITPTTQEAKRILSAKVETPFLERVSKTLKGEEYSKPQTRASTALEKGILGRETDIGVQSKRLANNLWKNKIEPMVENTTERITKDDIFAPIIKRIEDTAELGKKQALQDAFNAIKNDYKSVKDFSVKQAQKIKSELDSFTPEKIFKGKNVANEYTTLKNDMANAIRNKTYELLEDVNIKKDYIDWANLNELSNIGVKAISEGGKKGGFGGFWSSMYDMATTPIKTIGGQVLYRVGNKLEFIGQKGIKKFGDYLKSKGY